MRFFMITREGSGPWHQVARASLRGRPGPALNGLGREKGTGISGKFWRCSSRLGSQILPSKEGIFTLARASCALIARWYSTGKRPF